MTKTILLSSTTIDKFKAGLRGELIQRGDPHYEEARGLYNAMIDKRPLLIARCADVADVISAVRFARENQLLTAVRGGGHNGPGLGSCNDGLVIDLSLMKGVRVDPRNRTVRAEAGCTQGEVDHAAHPFGLAVPAGIVSSTGIAGLTLGGGHGYLSRKYGLTIDNLLLAHIYPINGAVHKVGRHETAWNCRDATWSLVICGIDPNPANARALMTWAKEYWDAIHPHNLKGAYVNYLMEEGEERIRATYGGNYDRLAAIKKKYDPTNFFRVNQNIKPA